jgi:integrase
VGNLVVKMDIQSAIILKRSPRIKKAKQKNGSVKEYQLKGGYFYRIRYISSAGRPGTAEQGPFTLKSQARDAMHVRTRELEAQGGRGQDRRNMTFAGLSEYCLNEGMYAEGMLKARRSVMVNIRNLGRYFNNFKIRNISRESLRDYKARRLEQYAPTKEGAPKRRISIATVNRELATLRAMLFFAIGEGWISYNPFFKIRLISTLGEVARDRLLSQDEERRLLAACEGSWTVPYERTRQGKKENLTATFTLDNKHLQTMIMIAVDSGMRLGEILKLEWGDIDFERDRITIRLENAKTGKGRVTILSERSKAALEALKPLSQSNRPFPYVDIKRSFATAKRLAGIKDLRFHDLRRTAITRWQANGVPLAFAGKSAGHSQVQTTSKYYSAVDDEQIEAIRKGVNSFNEPTLTSEAVN